MKNFPVIILAILLIGGCSGTVIDPVSFSEFSGSPGARNSSQNLWGLWEISYDFDSNDFEIIPLRTTDLTWNVTGFLQPPAGNPANLGVQILDGTKLISEGRIDVRVSVKHPFVNKKFRGFDVRGVVMGNASTIDSYNNSIRYPSKSEFRLLNADGYTRWMNASEFQVKGMLGFNPGAKGTPGFVPTATINGYKYFADDITPDESVFEYFAKSLAYVTARGSMSGGKTWARDYHLKFPTSPLQVKFQYAIIAGWEPNTTGGDNPIPSDFPQEANAFEAISLSVVDNSTLYYESSDNKGGALKLQLNIVDWWARWDKPNLSNYIGKIIISSKSVTFGGNAHKAIDFSTFVISNTQAGNAIAVDVVIDDAVPSGVENQEVLITIEMKNYNYGNPYGVPNLTSGDLLSGYFLHTLNVSPDHNDPPVITSGVNGPASAFITDTSTYTVTAVDPDTPSLDYAWTIRDPLTGNILIGPVPGNGAGSWQLKWATEGSSGAMEIWCEVSDGDNVVVATPKNVSVTDVIYHADLNDTTTGGNAGWSTTGSQGITKWTTFVGEDIILKGFGYKFGPFNASYQKDSADILVSPNINIPSAVENAVVVVNHSYQWEYYAPLEVGFDGSNFKITEAPTLPTFADPEVPMLAGKDYDGWLFDTAITDQKAFYSDQYTDEIQISAFLIPPALIGKSVKIGFAAATNYFDYSVNQGWLIDDVQVRAYPDGTNAPPVAGSAVTGDTVMPCLPQYSGTYKVVGYDLEDDPLTYAWTVRNPQSGDILWGPTMDDDEIILNWASILPPGQYEVHVSIYDGTHPGVPAEPLTVYAQEVIFHADLNDKTTGDNVGWSAILQTGTEWTSDVGTDTYLKGKGYKWAPFDDYYQPNSSAILLSPKIQIPSSVSSVSIYVSHDFEFIATLDGGNIKVTMDPTTPNFASPAEIVDGGLLYDTVLNGTIMNNQKAFGIGVLGLAVSRLDLLQSYQGKNIYIGFAAASGTMFLNQRGWLIDDVVVAYTP